MGMESKLFSEADLVSMGMAGMSKETQAAVLSMAKFIVDRATASALDVISVCAVDGNPMWRLFFNQGLADAISEDADIENDFFQRLCGGRGLPFSAEIISTYLSSLPAERVKKFLDISSLKRKAHPANQAFYGASFMNISGGYFLDIFNVFVKFGLTGERVDVVAARCFDELERACNLGNEQFMTAIIPMMTSVPEELVQRIVARSSQAESVINILVNKCGVSISVFTDPKIMVVARPSVAEYIVALEARSKREVEREISVEMDDPLV